MERGINSKRSNRWLEGYGIVSLLAFAVLAYLSKTRRTDHSNRKVTRKTQSKRSGWLNRVMAVPSVLGYAPQSYIEMGSVSGGMFLSGHPRNSIISLLTVAVSMALDGASKKLVQHPRPHRPRFMVQHHNDTTSFPSGHASILTSYYGYVWYASYTQFPSSLPRTFLLTALALLITLLGISRIYRGEHWLWDVVAGYLLSSSILAFAIDLDRRTGSLFQSENRGP